MKNMEYLANKGYLRPDSAILDIGSQCLYHASPEAIRSFVEKYGSIRDQATFETEAKRISYFSWPRPGERTSYVSELLDLTSIEYTSFDVCPALKTEIFDLNVENLSEKYRGHFDVVLNFGTTEHIFNQLNTFRVMHEALRVHGIFFHQLPTLGYADHGYFCYHDGFFNDLAKANDYEIVERWYTLAGQASLASEDVRDAEKPETSGSGSCTTKQLTIPSFNINVIMRKKAMRRFAIGLELATSHAAVSAGVANSYSDDDNKPQHALASVSSGASAVPGKELVRELGRRIARRFGIPQTAKPNTNVPCESAEKKSYNRATTSEILLPEVARMLTTEIVMPTDSRLDAQFCVAQGKVCFEKMAIPEAVGFFNRALTIIHQYPPAVIEMQKISEMYAKAATNAWETGDEEKALHLSVAAIEADPKNSVPRDLLATIDAKRARQDLTRNCYISYDPERAEAIRRETIRRCLEFTSIAGVMGDVMEFGVLGGWSARIFAETMRDLMVMGDIHLYDSFEGLPECESPVDQTSFEIGGRNIWSNKMKFPDNFVAALGGNLEKHIKENLSYVIRKERIKMHPGFYSETLIELSGTKAALVHIDCDLYQSTKEVLWGLFKHDALQDGTVIMFDDWNCNKANPAFGERRAFGEFLEEQQRFTKSDFFTYGFNGAAFILHQARV